jgi:glycosyltransferase involved in cell wall biosynthesis
VYNASVQVTYYLSFVPKFSILLPVFNGAQFLSAAIDSALNQTFEDFELLIADDHSTDESLQIIDNFAKQDRRIVAWQNEKNLGLFANYNQCLRRAGGELIKPFAQDDWFEPTILQEFHSVFREDSSVALVSCARRLVDAFGVETDVARYCRQNSLLERPQVLKDNLLTLKNMIGEPAAVAFKRSAAGDGFDENYYHLGDLEYWLRIIENGHYFYLDKTLCSFRQHARSTTNLNARGLRFAVDMIRLGKYYARFLNDIGITGDAYSHMIAQASASHVKFLLRHNEVSLEGLVNSEHETAESIQRDLPAFKELAFHALMLAGEALEENYALKQEWEAERNKLEDNIAKLMSSRSWKLTVPLRGAARAFRATRNR